MKKKWRPKCSVYFAIYFVASQDPYEPFFSVQFKGVYTIAQTKHTHTHSAMHVRFVHLLILTVLPFFLILLFDLIEQ